MSQKIRNNKKLNVLEEIWYRHLLLILSNNSLFSVSLNFVGLNVSWICLCFVGFFFHGNKTKHFICFIKKHNRKNMSTVTLSEKVYIKKHACLYVGEET